MHIVMSCNALLPANGYGGTERQVVWLAKALTDLGHEVTLLSKIERPLSFCRHLPLPNNLQSKKEWEACLPKHWDIIHFNHSVSFELNDWPYVISCHGNGRPGQHFLKNTIFVSENHAHRHHSVDFVYNGLDLTEYPLEIQPNKNKELVFLAKASWKVKNLDGALQISTKSRHRLNVIGGKRFSTFRSIFSRNANFHGVLTNNEKIKVLQKSKALLFPILWHEPFGIAIIEALACGLPVIGSRYGSLPEIISPNCGFICSSENEFLKAIENLPSINPLACRQRVEENFTSMHSAKKYLEYYRKVLHEKYLSSEAPFVAMNENPGECFKNF